MNNSPYKTVQLCMHSFQFFLLEEDTNFTTKAWQKFLRFLAFMKLAIDLPNRKTLDSLKEKHGWTRTTYLEGMFHGRVRVPPTWRMMVHQIVGKKKKKRRIEILARLPKIRLSKRIKISGRYHFRFRGGNFASKMLVQLF